MTPSLTPASPRNRTRFLVTHVNVVKLLTLAVLVPPVSVGLTQRAAALVGTDAAATVVPMLSAWGSVLAVVGALVLGRISDFAHGALRWRWGVVTAAVGVGGTGIWTMFEAETLSALLGGWLLTQAGFSGAMAVLRVLLAHAPVSGRRRGATAMVAISYLGAALPLGVLAIFPRQVWSTTAALAILAIALAAWGILNASPERADPTYLDPADPVDDHNPMRTGFGWPLLLLVQFSANLTLSAYLAYHALEIASRQAYTVDAGVVRLSVVVLIAALIGLLAATGLLLARPQLLAHTRRLVIVAGALLGLSIAARPFVDAIPALLAVVAVTGAAVGINSSAVFAAVLDNTDRHTMGGRIGMYSAAGPLGQFTGPLLAMWVYGLGPARDYTYTYLAIAAVPAAWAMLAVFFGGAPRGSHRDRELIPSDREESRNVV